MSVRLMFFDYISVGLARTLTDALIDVFSLSARAYRNGHFAVHDTRTTTLSRKSESQPMAVMGWV
jgi:hypothetical protein